ncbi:hypothetical protein FVE67_02710 [Thermosulfurimonas marina]|uniref:Uncharacterized protein n=1 Tax=Thermosulfurimonas marina TaxID=2047767 RepID=A0A6H1WRC9_9BACT|nr:hypothetical protein [Thermosulfurimonas marina]QJA05775.1 hypothetical protein FVE67_02710 [Thermosulfurimonas marina]
MGEILLVLSPHRLEFLPRAFELMEECETVILEEPRHPEFEALLSGKTALTKFLEISEPGFPEYSRAVYQKMRELFSRGRQVLQVEPYLEGVQKIQARLAAGEEPEALQRDPELSPIYQHEHQTFGRLLDFYAALSEPFESLVEKIKAFAQADAARLIFRDTLRAQALRQILKGLSGQRVYLETGYIHLYLVRELARKPPAGFRLRVRNLVRLATGGHLPRGLWPAPGDVLTAFYLFEKRRAVEEDLLAARSLVYIRLIEKNELQPSPENPFPHLRDEVFFRAFVRGLSFEDCRRLDARIRLLPTAEARQVAQKSFPEIWKQASQLVDQVFREVKTSGGLRAGLSRSLTPGRG